MKANDYISRHEALRVLQINFGDYCGARRALCEIPAADVAPVVHGHFVHDGPSLLAAWTGGTVATAAVWCVEWRRALSFARTAVLT